MAMSSNRFDDLPVELLLRIVTLMDIQTLLAFIQVSKQLRKQCGNDDVWKPHYDAAFSKEDFDEHPFGKYMPGFFQKKGIQKQLSSKTSYIHPPQLYQFHSMIIEMGSSDLGNRWMEKYLNSPRRMRQKNFIVNENRISIAREFVPCSEYLSNLIQPVSLHSTFEFCNHYVSIDRSFTQDYVTRNQLIFSETDVFFLMLNVFNPDEIEQAKQMMACIKNNKAPVYIVGCHEGMVIDAHEHQLIELSRNLDAQYCSLNMRTMKVNPVEMITNELYKKMKSFYTMLTFSPDTPMVEEDLAKIKPMFG